MSQYNTSIGSGQVTGNMDAFANSLANFNNGGAAPAGNDMGGGGGGGMGYDDVGGRFGQQINVAPPSILDDPNDNGFGQDYERYGYQPQPQQGDWNQPGHQGQHPQQPQGQGGQGQAGNQPQITDQDYQLAESLGLPRQVIEQHTQQYGAAAARHLIDTYADQQTQLLSSLGMGAGWAAGPIPSYGYPQQQAQQPSTPQGLKYAPLAFDLPNKQALEEQFGDQAAAIEQTVLSPVRYTIEAINKQNEQLFSTVQTLQEHMTRQQEQAIDREVTSYYDTLDPHLKGFFGSGANLSHSQQFNRARVEQVAGMFYKGAMASGRPIDIRTSLTLATRAIAQPMQQAMGRQRYAEQINRRNSTMSAPMGGVMGHRGGGGGLDNFIGAYDEYMSQHR